MAVTKKTTLTEPELDALMIAGNYSTLKIKIEFSPNNSQTYFSSKTLKCTCDGVEQTKSVSLSQGGSVSKTFTFENINHDANGSKTVSWSWSIATGTTVLGTLKDSGSKQLQTIPRASELSVSSGDHYFGEDIQVTTTSKTYSKNTITYSIFGQQRGSYNTYYLIPNQTHTGTTNFPLYLINNIPNSTSATATFTCASTFAVNGSSIPESDLGTSTLQVNLQVPDSVKPTATIGTLSEANSTMTSFSPRWNIYVQNHSQLSIPITANGTYSSKITSIKVTTNEETFNYNVPTPNTTISYTFTTGLLKTSGSNTINVEVTDTRGRKGTTSTTYNVVAYSSPTISSTSVERVSSGTAGQDNLKYSFVGSSNNIGNNASMTTFKVGYKLRDSSSYTYMTSETLAGSSSINRSNVTVATPTLSSDNTYDIQFYVKDAFNEVSISRELETEGDLLNFNDNGKAMAIGKVSEAGANEELLEIALPTKFTEYVKDELVVESIRSKNMFDKNSAINGYYYTATGTGTSGNWYIEKIEVKSSTNYYLSGNNYSNTTARIVLIDSSNNIIQNVGGYSEVHLITTTSSTKYIGLSIADYDGTGDMNTLQLEEGSIATNYSTHQHFEISNWIDKSSEITINNSNIQTNRTKLFVNEDLRLVFLQVFYTATVSSTVSRPIQYPYMYRPAFLSSDQLWFTMSPSNGGANTCRGTIKYDTTNGTYIDIFTVSNSVAAPFGNIVYPY